MAGPVTAREVRHEETCAEILAAAATAIAQHGYHGMSMRRLAQATERGLASFYNYFASKEDVLFEIQQRAFETLRASAQEAVAAGQTPADRLYAFALNHVRYFAAHRDVMRVLIHESAALPATRRRKVREAKEAYYEVARAIIADIMTTGCGLVELAAGTTRADEVERATYCVFGMLNWVYGWYDPERHGDPAEVARTVQRLALCGLVARCPHGALSKGLERQLSRRTLMPLLGQS